MRDFIKSKINLGCFIVLLLIFVIQHFGNTSFIEKAQAQNVDDKNNERNKNEETTPGQDKDHLDQLKSKINFFR